MKYTAYCLAVSLALALGSSSIADAKGGHTSSGHYSSRSYSSHSGHASGSSHPRTSRTAPGVKRNSHGKIARSSTAKHQFQKSHPCPSTGKSSGACPGYVIDHVMPLKRGGADRPSNMQWQTKQAAKDKDKWE